MQIKSEIRVLVNELNEKAKQIWGRELKPISIEYKEKGKVAGLAQYQKNNVSFNWQLLENNFDFFIKDTCPHEVAHLICNQIYRKQIGHGIEWKLLFLF